VGLQDVARLLRLPQPPSIHQKCLRVGRLDVHHRLDHRFDLRLDVVGLIDHVSHRPGRLRRPRVLLRCDQLIEDQEEFEGIDGPDDQVVVGVFPIVEMEAPQPALIQQEGHDVLDVGPLGMVTGVHQDLGLGPEVGCDDIGHPPVCQIGVIEGRLEELIFDQHPHPRRHPAVDLRESLQHAMFAHPEVVLTGVVGAVGEPEAQDGGADLFGDLDALQHVLHRPTPNPGIRMADAAQPVIVVLEQVGVHRSDLKPQAGGVLPQAFPIFYFIPRDVDGHRGTHACESMHHRRVRQLLVDVPGCPRPWKHLKTSAGVAITPGGRLDPLPLQGSLHRLHIHAPAGQGFRQGLISRHPRHGFPPRLSERKALSSRGRASSALPHARAFRS